MAVIDRPVFVGVDHSGTTIFYRMMARHPQQYAEEWGYPLFAAETGSRVPYSVLRA